MAKRGEIMQGLIGSLREPEEAAAYLNAAIGEGDRQLFLLALRNVAEAQGGVAAVASRASMSRESVYRMLSERGNPEMKSLCTLLQSMGLRLAVESADVSAEG